MAQTLPDLTPAQLKVYETVQRNRMAWVALWFTLVPFSLAFVAFLAALFFATSVEAKGVLLVFNGLLGWMVQRVFRFLFPTKK
jgi:hypothetical protein